MNKYHRWLNKELGNWESEQLVDAALARELRNRYSDTAETSWGRLIFSVIGATVFGLGIILFFAYNWAAMPKFLKLAVIAGALLCAHVLAMYFRSSAKQHTSASEGLHVLGTMLFGSGIWLVAQIYHMDEHYPNALLVWGLGALALAWAIPSIAQGVIAVALLSLWSCFEVFDFDVAPLTGPVIVLLGLVTLAWQQRSRVLLFLSLCAFMLQTALVVVTFDELAAFHTLILITCLTIALSVLCQRAEFVQAAPVIRIAGFVVYLILLFMLSFELPRPVNPAPDAAETDPGWWPMVAVFVPFGASLVAWLLALAQGNWRQYGWVPATDNALVILTTVLIPLTYLHSVNHWQLEWLLVLAFNCIFIAHALLLIVLGGQRINIRLVATGCVLLTIILSIRFTDLFDSLLVRSALFLALGAGLFWVGNFYARQQDRSNTAGDSHA